MGISSKEKTLKMAELAMLVALVVVLQILSALIPPIGGVAITLTLVPVVIGAILFGVKGGFALGVSFGCIVLINCIAGLDVGGNILWSTNAVFTAIICFVKGIAAGVVPAFLYRLIVGKQEPTKTRKTVAALVAAATAPIVNTSIFIVGALLFFTDVLVIWADGTKMITYIIVGLAGFNFLIEFIINIILTPAIVRITDVIGKKKSVRF